MPMLDLDPAAREVATLLDHIDDDRLDGPTPCEEMSVAALLEHIAGLCLAFTWAAHKTTPAPPAASNGLDPQWRIVIPERLRELVGAWRDPGAWVGMTEAGGVRMPADVIGLVALDELVLHGWDLARATGHPYRCDEASAAAVLEFTTMMSRPEHAENREGLFGPALEVPAHAPLFDRALRLAGRDPAWAPKARAVTRSTPSA